MSAGDDARLASARALLKQLTALVGELDHALNDPTPAAPTPEPTKPPTERPGPGNTGVPAGTNMQVFTSRYLAKIPGEIIDHRLLLGGITVYANDVRILRSRINASATASPSDYPVKVASSDVTGLVIEDCEIDGNGRTSLCVGTKNYTLRRCNVHGAAGDLLRADGNVLVEDSWLHDIVRVEGGHHDAVQMLKGSKVTLRHNTIDIVNDGDPMNACFIISASAPVSDVTIENNWLNGGNYSLYLGANTKGIPVTNVTARGNVISGYRYGPIHGGARGTAVLERNVDTAGKGARMSGPAMPITYYCDDCGQLVHLDHVPTEQTSDGLVFNLVPAMRAHLTFHT